MLPPRARARCGPSAQQAFGSAREFLEADGAPACFAFGSAGVRFGARVPGSRWRPGLLRLRLSRRSLRRESSRKQMAPRPASPSAQQAFASARAFPEADGTPACFAFGSAGVRFGARVPGSRWHPGLLRLRLSRRSLRRGAVLRRRAEAHPRQKWRSSSRGSSRKQTAPRPFPPPAEMAFGSARGSASQARCLTPCSATLGRRR